jgi:hypothetical protein
MLAINTHHQNAIKLPDFCKLRVLRCHYLELVPLNSKQMPCYPFYNQLLEHFNMNNHSHARTLISKQAWCQYLLLCHKKRKFYSFFEQYKVTGFYLCHCFQKLSHKNYFHSHLDKILCFYNFSNNDIQSKTRTDLNIVHWFLDDITGARYRVDSVISLFTLFFTSEIKYCHKSKSQ